MTKLFLTVLNMSITGTLVILAVLVLRVLFKRLPRICSYLLWSVVLLRLICPFAIEADFGIIPSIRIGEEQTLHTEALLSTDAEMEEALDEYVPVDLGKGALTYGEAGMQSAKTASGWLTVWKDIPFSVWQIVAVIWLIGMVPLMGYGIFSYHKLLTKLHKLPEQSQKLVGHEDYNVVISQSIEPPFTAGFVRPTIYLPAGLAATEMEMVMEHEKTHIRRKDYLVKAAAYFITCVHWFNPFVWLSFRLMEADMETSCDEAVLRRVGYDKKKTYAKALLSLSSSHPMEIGGCPLAFGENNVKERIKNAVELKKVKTWIAVISAILVVGVIVLLSINNTGKNDANASRQIQQENAVDGLAELPDRAATNDGVVNDMQEPEEPKVNVDEDIVSEEPESANEATSSDLLTDSSSVLLVNQTDNYHDVQILYDIPLPEGTYQISATYGTRVHPISGTEVAHNGIDFSAEEGTDIQAAADGWVYETGFHSYCGNYVIVCHDNGEVTYYSHCSEVLVEDGQSVARGETIARVGSTGVSTGPHLHFAVSHGGVYIEPVFEANN